MPRSTLIEQQIIPPSIMYDNPSSFHVEDFFNLDMLTSANDDAAPSASSSSNTAQSHSDAPSTSSRASSEARTDSPAGSYAHLQTPPQSDALPSFDMSGLGMNMGMGMGMNIDMSALGGLPPIEEESMFTFSGSEFFKPGTDPLAGLSHAPYDLFGSFDSALGGSATSNEAPASASTSSNTGASFPFAIDPQLVGTSAASTSADSPSDAGAEPDSDDDEPRGLVVAPVKVGGRGKARRGTLHSGGVSKKPALPGPQSIFGSLSNGEGPSPVMGKGAGKTKDAAAKSSNKEKAPKDKDRDNEDAKDDMDADDWRPSPEEYQKMSSKEKRQLRNKISARNFRVRRKEYIHTLEGDIADRDRVIDAIRTELGSTKSENTALRQEVAVLKKAILAGRASPMLPPPAPLSPLSPLSSFAALPSSSSSSNNSSSANGSSGSGNSIIKPNTHKDLPTSPRLAASGASPFWGGQAGFGGFGGGITPVHTAIIPETAAAVFGGSSAGADRESENINPAMNRHHQQQQQTQQQQALSQVLSHLYGASAGASSTFDSFSDVNPFTLKTLDAYRMQLWGRVAMQAQQAQAQRARATNSGMGYPSPAHSPKPNSNANANGGLSGLASSLRPQYFSSAGTPTSPTTGAGAGKPPFGALLSGKGLPYAYHGHGQHGHTSGHGHGLPSPPPSPRVGEKERAKQGRRAQQQKEQREQAQTHALLATLASQTVLQKMGQAFWDAFSGSGSASSLSASSQLSSPSSGMGPRAWDAEKVRRVLEGTAVLRVVDVEHAPPSPSPLAPSAAADALSENMRSLSLGGTGSRQDKKKEEGSEKKGFLARMSCGGCGSKQ